MIIKSERNNCYNYDNRSGQIIFVPEDLTAKDIKNRYDSIVNSTKKQIIEVTQKGLYDYLYTDGNGFKQLIIELTTACNFRCKYCIYSDYYPQTRSHGQQLMSIVTAKKAVDFYFDNFEKTFQRNPMKKPIISFYGGEPLLHLEQLKEIVDYSNSKFKEYEVTYNLTTNGLLFDSKAQKFLVDNKFAILISLDGYKENHDRNRVDVHNNGTFDRIVNNIMEFREKYPDAFATISTCFDYKTDMEKMSEFFDSFPLFVTNIAQVQSSNGTYYNQFESEDANRMVEGYNALKDKFFVDIKNNNIDRESFLYRYFGAMYGDFAYHPMILEEQPDIKPYTGTCIPGEKLYVSADGTFKICEKINSSYSIGHVETGIDMSKVCKIMNDYYEVLRGKCDRCEVSRLCKLCYKDFDGADGFIKSEKICSDQREKLKRMLVDYVNLMETNPELFEDITIDYYSFLSKAGELA